MIIRKPVTENDMVFEFLRAELRSPRFSRKIREELLKRSRNEQLITEAHFFAEENKIRKDILKASRPGIFKTLPVDISWNDILLEEKDWDRVFYMRLEDWRLFSKKTRRVLDGAKRIGESRHQTITRRVLEIQNEIKHGKMPPKIILLSKLDCRKLVLIEGHVRATAFVFSQLHKEQQIPALLGITTHASEWGFY